MDSFDGHSLARPLGCGEVGPVELPPARTMPGRQARQGRGPWVALGTFAILGATAILVASGPAASSASSVGKVWQSESDDKPAPGDAAREEIYALKIDGLPNLGRSDAKVTLVVIADYACSTCLRTRPLIKSLRSAYGDDLRVVYKPHASTEAAVPSLAGACAASLQGELEAFDEARASTSAPVDSNGVFRIAKQIGLDMTRFTSAMRRCELAVKASTAEIDGFGFTEAYFVNGRIVDPWGVDSLATFESLIDAQLVTAKQRIAAGASAERYYQQFVLDVGQTTR